MGSEMIYVSVHASVLVTKVAVWLSIVPLELHGKHHSSVREAFMPRPHTQPIVSVQPTGTVQRTATSAPALARPKSWN